jgi:Holliday junction DNA helicase RuvA
MIGWLSGKVRGRDPAHGTIQLDVGGVGYQLTVSLQTFADIPADGQRCQLFVHTHVREEALTLFGFANEREKLVFKMLTSVPKVGPKHAISVLGGFPLDDVVLCIAHGEAGTLQRIPGIGKKTADQIVLSLRDKMMAMAAAGSGETNSPTPPRADAVRDEAAAALIQWGWKAKSVAQALDSVLDEAGDEDLLLEDLLMRATRMLTER